MCSIKKLLSLWVLVLATLCLVNAPEASAASKYNSWSEVAGAMDETLDKSHEAYVKGEPDAAFDLVNEAYFGFYEKEGFERNVKGRISGKRASQVEYKFAVIKKKIRDGAPEAEVRVLLTELSDYLIEDAAKLDARVQQAQASTTEASGQTAKGGKGAAAPQQQASFGRDWAIFLAAFGTLLREGFEAILVIAAIAAYLYRSGNNKSIRVVYYASLAAIVASVLAAVALQYVFSSFSGAKQEVIEGLTMLLATVVLFCVSNWMFSKAEAEAWKQYIENKVQLAVTTGSAAALSTAAFLAVFREGAETILFFQGILTEAGTDTTMVWAGFAVGCVALVIVFILLRFGTMKIPLKPFFLGTSILMFIMSISFLGGGIKELQEGDALPTTMLEGFPTVELLGVYPTLQTLVPQIGLLILTFASILIIHQRSKRFRTAAA
ncbi:MAG: FTR1 family iron permease [Deltaproteobacteria bacterium]|jgi:high-affinity iron transporter|nr:FTR1 family iron permease [Deltaproteobacteria bacterium]